MITSKTTLAVCTALYLPALNGFTESLLVFAKGHQIPDRRVLITMVETEYFGLQGFGNVE
jgi:hypothetical protein